MIIVKNDVIRACTLFIVVLVSLYKMVVLGVIEVELFENASKVELFENTP